MESHDKYPHITKLSELYREIHGIKSPEQILCDKLGISLEEYKKSDNGILESFLDPKYRRAVWNNVMLSEDWYIAYLLKAVTLKTDEEAKEFQQADDYQLINAQFKTDLGYFAGYYDVEVRLRIERIFDTSHSILGKMVDKGNEKSYILEAALWWTKQFINQEVEERRLAEEDKRKLLESTYKEVKDNVNHHSNKVRRRSIKEYNKVLDLEKDKQKKNDNSGGLTWSFEGDSI